MSLANGFSILFILSKNQLLALLIFAMVSFFFFFFISALIFKISFLLLTLGFFISSFSICFGCCVFIFIHFYANFDFFFDFFCDLLVIQQGVVHPPYVGIFNSFSPVIEI